MVFTYEYMLSYPIQKCLQVVELFSENRRSVNNVDRFQQSSLVKIKGQKNIFIVVVH